MTRLSGSMRLLHPQLLAIVAKLESAQARLHRLEARTPDDKWAARAHPNRWSIGECIAHLNLTSRAYVPLLRSAFESDPRVHKPPKRYRMDFVGWLLSRATGELPRLGGWRLGRMRTHPRFVPDGPLDREMVVAEFNTHQHELIMLTHHAEQRAIDRIRIVSPFNPRVSYNAYSCLVILPRHQHRHLAQAEDVWGAPAP